MERAYPLVFTFDVLLHSPALTTSTVYVLGAVAGLLAALVSNVPMHRLPEGSTAPFVAAGLLTDSDPDAVDPTLASGVHYAAGILAGVFYTAVEYGIEAVAPPPRLYVGGTQLPLLTHLLALLVTFAFLVGFFSYVVLPRFDALAPSYGQIRRD
ncbi:MAG: hypothetical protein U5K28_12015 [Halobacteriales archaeon]|nr:hypothetical protein [Halobacteriales archaeon]